MKKLNELLIFGAVVLFLLLDKNVHSFKNNNYKYKIVIDAGSTGSRLHVYKFGNNSTLVKEFYEKVCTVKQKKTY